MKLKTVFSWRLKLVPEKTEIHSISNARLLERFPCSSCPPRTRSTLSGEPRAAGAPFDGRGAKKGRGGSQEGSQAGGGSQGAGAACGAVRGWRRPGAGTRRVPAMRNAEGIAIKLELDIQKDRMGKLIGTNGQTIKNIQQQVSAVRLNTPTKDDAASDEYKFVAVTLKGKAADVFKASKMVHDVATACLAVLTFRIGAASRLVTPAALCCLPRLPGAWALLVPALGRALTHQLGDRAAIR